MDTPLIDTVEGLFTSEVRREFSVSSVTAASARKVRFRLDPGKLFERRAYFTRTPDGSTHVGLSQRYQPYDELTWVGSELLGADLAPQLRVLVQYADWLDRRPPWRTAHQNRASGWIQAFSTDDTASIAKATRLVTTGAREEGIAHYLRWTPGTILCSNNPFAAEVMFSVSPPDEWSWHVGPETRPIGEPPDLSGVVVPNQAAWLAAQDLGTGPATKIRSGFQEVQPPAGPALRPPGRAR